VRGVSLTGSVAAGRHIGRIAGEELKKVVLELGGSDAYLVLEDADVPQAAEVCAAARLVNAGQSCVAAKRFIVVEAVREAFESALIEVLKAKKLGDPMDDGTDVGPMARADLRDELHRQVQKSIELGARCMLGGQVPEGPGAYYPVTLLTGVKPGMPAWEEELFGPVAATLIAEDETHALAIANQSRFGLGGAVFSRDLERARRVAAEMDCGMVAINRQLESDPRLPFGGVKESGVGREVGEFGIMEFVNIKTVTLSAAGGTTRTARSE
jgi:succinate-semialdehyde dehydrogenase/glutarate-semialdehyde dehydrogenase